jgi:hypothetical protein
VAAEIVTIERAGQATGSTVIIRASFAEPPVAVAKRDRHASALAGVLSYFDYS